MANGKFVPNRSVYLQVLNGSDAYQACDRQGAYLCKHGSAAGHGSYIFDTIRGKTRIHTRVKTADKKSFFQERSTHNLAHIVRRYW